LLDTWQQFEPIKVEELRNQFVRFKISDIYLPDPLVILNKLHGEDMLEGRLVDISVSGSRPEQFAVIDVPELDQMIIVPLKRVEDVS
jgi:hypothetical protein